jgi:hypothetical protein
MQAIGWTPLAMYQRLPDGGVHCMGVEKTCPDEDHCARTWGQFHAIQMRTPVQLPADVHPRGDWWAAVWQFLYDREASGCEAEPEGSPLMINMTTVDIQRRIAGTQECRQAARCFYMIAAALDIMESTFGDRGLHEQTLGRKNAFYVSPQQLDLIMYLLYQCSDNATKLRDELAT